MKKLLLGVLIGFLLNTGLRAYYSYLWWSTEKTISNEEMNNCYNKYKSFKCVNDKIGIKDNIKYTLITPVYTFGRWDLEYP